MEEYHKTIEKLFFEQVMALSFRDTARVCRIPTDAL